MTKTYQLLSTVVLWLMILLLYSCLSLPFPKNHHLPQPEPTHTVAITEQVKKTYHIDNIHIDNLFDGARLNDFIKINDSTYRAVISPENTPINKSSYYAFRAWSDKAVNLDLELFYTEHKHRYWPKISYDKNNWIRVDSTRFDTMKAGNIATLKLFLNTQPLYIAGQEVIDSKVTADWCDELSAKYPVVEHQIIGKSTLGRDMHFLDITNGPVEEKPTIVILSRLHPPEVTGYMAMEAFVEELLRENILSNTFLNKFRILVYPLVNPDGVDMGHWRHNAGGVDLNRDWAFYRQKEVRLVADHIVQTIWEDNNDVVLGLDFHSTQEDVYYSLTDNRRSKLYNFKDLWIHAIDETFPEYKPDDQPYDLNQPITKAWFFLEFNAESITYEVGDETPRDFVRAKARTAASEMMKLLVLRD